MNIPANEQRLDPALVNEISSLTSADDDGDDDDDDVYYYNC